MKTFIPLLVLSLLVAFLLPAPARAESSGKANFESGMVVYFGLGTTATGYSVDTVAFTSDRNFTDSAYYDIAVFVSNLNATGPWKASVLDDSSVVVTSATAGDSLKSYFYLIFYRPK